MNAAELLRHAAARPIRMVIADDHDVVREGLRALLANDPSWKVCGEAATGREAVALAAEKKPDVVILDVSMPDLNGIEAARQIRRISPRSEILILTMHDSDQLLGEALDMGVRGYVLKSDAGRELVAAVDALVRHRPFFSSGVAETLLDGYRRGDRKRSRQRLDHYRLTPRERQIVQLLAEGKSNKEVAVALGISVKTAETHRSNVFQKLEIHSLAELVRYAIRNKIVEP
jgi:DNA-binding NarL/FixJ family response regulator